MTKLQPISGKSDESIAYMNSINTIEVIFLDGRLTVTTIQKLDEVINTERARRKERRRAGKNING